jgi:S-formylglutathione hydrolase FrmB
VRGRSLIAVLAVAVACGALAAGARASEVVTIPIPDRNGEIPSRWLPRYPHGGPPLARVFLPDGYDPHKAYPLLVLLVGLSSNYSDWSDPGQGEIATTAKGFPGIIVMPEGGDGWYTDWWNGGRRGSPAWESYILDQVIPQTLARYRIRPQRRYHALAGVSMGGLGTAYLGGRLPGFFGSVAVISGLVDTELLPYGENWVESAISTASARATIDLDAVDGPPGAFYARGHNPVRLAANLQHTRVFVTTGNGVPVRGRISTVDETSSQAAEGLIIRPASDAWVDALRAAGADVTYRVHTGFHDWFNFRQELRDAIAWGLFEPVDEDPASWVDDTVATHGTLWGFSYRFDDPPDRIVRLRRRGATLSISAAGSPVTIRTDDGCVAHLATPGRAPAVCEAARTHPRQRARARRASPRAPRPSRR